MNIQQIKDWQAKAVATLAKYREIDTSVNTDKKIEIEVWKIRVFQHKIDDLCRMLLEKDVDKMLGDL